MANMGQDEGENIAISRDYTMVFGRGVGRCNDTASHYGAREITFTEYTKMVSRIVRYTDGMGLLFLLLMTLRY